MSEKINIVNFNTLLKRYEGMLTRDELRTLLNMKGCPVLPRKENGPYKILLDQFEEWLSNQKNPKNRM